MAERTKATVLKTVSGATRSWVRIPLLPPAIEKGSLSIRLTDRGGKPKPANLI
jgi:hypothetical protein